MEDFYLKYESGYGKLTRSLLDEIVEKWIDGLTEEIEVLTMMKSEGLGEDYDLFIQLLEIISNQFIDYAKEILRHIDLLPGKQQDYHIDDSSLTALVCFLKDNYNSILVIIEKLYSFNNNLIAIRHEVLKSQNCNNLSARLMKINLNNNQLNQLLIEVNNLKDAQVRQKHNFSLLNKKGYPTIKEMNELCNQYKENQSAQKEQFKRLYGAKALQKINNKTQKTTQLKEVSILHHYQGKELSATLNNCKELSKEIDEKMKKYCVCYNYPDAVEQIQKIKKDNIKIDDNISYAKTEIKDLIKGIKELTTRIERFDKENNDIIILNNTINQQIQSKNKHSIQKNPSPFITWNTQTNNNNNNQPYLNNSIKPNSNQSIILMTSNPNQQNQQIPEQSSHHTIQRNNSAFNYPSITLTEQNDNKFNTSPAIHHKRYLLTKK